MLTKQEIMLGRGVWAENRVREPSRTTPPCILHSQVLWLWVSFQVVSGQSFLLRVLPGGVHITQQRKILVRKILAS